MKMKTIINEIDRIKIMMGIITEDHGQIMSIIDLSHVVSRLGMDQDVILVLLHRAYRHSGDEGVVEMFKEMTGLTISAIRRGRYVMMA